MLLGQVFHALWQAELVEAGNLLGDEAKGKRDRAALPVAVDTEAAQALGHVGRVELSVRVEALALGRGELGHGLDDRLEVTLG
jgi:hypothetical protein